MIESKKNNVPYDIEMEKKLLSAMMLQEGIVIPKVAEILKVEDFYREEHKIIYRTLLKLSDGSEPIDVLLTEQELRRTGELSKVERRYLYSLVEMEYTTARAKSYAKVILEKSKLRKLIYEGRVLIDEASREMKSAEEILMETEQKLSAMTNELPQKMEEISPIIIRTFEQISNPNVGRGVTTGLLSLNMMTGGLKKSDLIILAARPSMGKTALALNIALAASRTEITAVFSLEMSKEQLAQRMLSSVSEVSADKIKNRDLSDGDWHDLVNAINEISERKLFIEDTGMLTLPEIRAHAKRLKREQGLGLIIIDYLQLMQGGKEYRGNRVQEVSEISRGLKSLAKELDVPILTLSQLSRQVEVRADKKPQLSDLRESGSIEQDADIVMFLYREEYYNREDSANPKVAELIIAKNRNGATGTVHLHFERECLLFRELTREEE